MNITLPSLLQFALYAFIGGFCWTAGALLFTGILSLFGRSPSR